MSSVRLLATTQKENGAWLNACRFCRLGHYWTLRALGLPLSSKWALMFVFPVLAAAAGGYTIGICMACPTNTVLAASQGIQQ